MVLNTPLNSSRSSRSEVFLRKVVLKICNRFTGENPCRNAISIKLQSNFIEIALRHGCSPVNLLHIFKILFLKNTSGQLLLAWSYSKTINFELIHSNSSLFLIIVQLNFGCHHRLFEQQKAACCAEWSKFFVV